MIIFSSHPKNHNLLFYSLKEQIFGRYTTAYWYKHHFFAPLYFHTSESCLYTPLTSLPQHHKVFLISNAAPVRLSMGSTALNLYWSEVWRPGSLVPDSWLDDYKKTPLSWLSSHVIILYIIRCDWVKASWYLYHFPFYLMCNEQFD